MLQLFFIYFEFQIYYDDLANLHLKILTNFFRNIFKNWSTNALPLCHCLAPDLGPKANNPDNLSHLAEN